MNDIQLTPHFRLSEFTRSATATARHIDNSLDPSDPCTKQIIDNLRSLCENILEPLRAAINTPSLLGEGRGEASIIINSGYRCPKLNKAVGGVTNSQHMTGEAADIRVPDAATGNKWFLWMMDNLQFDQLIFEHNKKGTYWIHVSYRKGHNRQTVIRNLVKNKS